jgi:hypothetical protein
LELFYGVVTNNDDPSRIGRVQVRIYGEHDDTTDDDTLPWAEVAQSASIGLVGGIGLSSVLKVGTWVYVTKLHSSEVRYIVLGVCVGVQGESGDTLKYGRRGLSDFAQMCTSDDDLRNSAKDDTTTTSNGVGFGYNSTVTPGDYLNSTILRTESGIVIELNDNLKMLKVTHPSGSVIQISRDGTVSVTSLNNLKINTKGSLDLNVREDFNVNVDGNVNFDIGGSINYQIASDCNQSVLGNWDLKCNGDVRQFGYSNISYKVSNNMSFDVGNTLSVKNNSHSVDTKTFNVSSTTGRIKYVDITTPKAIDLSTHVHTGVRRGDSSTDVPK